MQSLVNGNSGREIAYRSSKTVHRRMAIEKNPNRVFNIAALTTGLVIHIFTALIYRLICDDVFFTDAPGGELCSR